MESKKFNYNIGLVIHTNRNNKTSIIACDPKGRTHNEKEFCGTIVFTEDKYWEIGRYSNNWAKAIWKEFHGEVTLSH